MEHIRDIPEKMIPVCEPLLGDKELEYVTDCVKTNWISSNGKYITEFEEGFSKYCGRNYGVSTTNGTTALHLALASIGIREGDEIIMPSFTIISTALAATYCGAKPVLVDCERDTWCMDVSQIEEKITQRTKAILPVHMYGHPCDMDPILEIADNYGLYVVEDAAEVHGAEYKGRKAGGMGDVGCFSFYANKIITTGEGGMVVTNDGKIAENARSLRNLAFPKGKRSYQHEMIGFNYRMTNIQAAIGLAQLERIDELVERRRKNALLYNSLLKDVNGITLPVERDWARNVYWMYSILIEDGLGIARDELMDKLKENGVDSRTFFVPMHEQKIFREMGLFEGEKYPVSKEISRKGMYLPSGSGLTEEQIRFVCERLIEIVQ